MKKIALIFLCALAACSSAKEEPQENPTPTPTPTPTTKELKVSPALLTFEATGAQPKTVTVTSSSSWKAACDASWLSFVQSSDGKTLSVSVQDNVTQQGSEPAEREADIIITNEDDLSTSIAVTQEKGAPAQPEPVPSTLKVLAIGNSFSCDAVEQELYGLLAGAGVQNIIIGDMYIGGCPLSKHAANAKADAAAYSYRKIVNGTLTKTADVKLSTALKDEQWDFISVQEGAGFHGYYNRSYKTFTHSMEPDLTDLISYLNSNSANKDFKLIFHSCWAAKTGYTGVKFSYYDYDQTLMYNMICEATKEVVAAHKDDIDIVMNSMDAVQNARTSFIGDNMNRDGWHLNYTTGRYTVSCLWCEKLLGRSVVGNTYHPSTISDYVAEVCQTAAHQAAENPYKVTDLSYFEKPADDSTANVKVLAKWYFSPERSKSDGLIKTWTGQEELGVYRYSNEPGERGYYNANEEGSGKLSYVQIDKTQWSGNNAGLSSLSASNGGQPVMCGPMPGDYWLFETTGGYEFDEGTQLHMIYTYNPGSYGAKYWMIEYMDGTEWKPAFETSKITISLSGEEIEYNVAYTTSQKIIEFTVTLENQTKEFKVRQMCCSEYQVNDKWFDHPNVKSVSRIAGDPNNEAKPLPQMDQLI